MIVSHGDHLHGHPPGHAPAHRPATLLRIGLPARLGLAGGLASVIWLLILLVLS